MNLTKLIADLREEHARIVEVILSLEKLAGDHGPRRGRPPGTKNKSGTKRKTPLAGLSKASTTNYPNDSARICRIDVEDESR